jgi:cyclophilin family peptidyl-prolyl cis-trans isomerase/HEAT repeat protein
LSVLFICGGTGVTPVTSRARCACHNWRGTIGTQTRDREESAHSRAHQHMQTPARKILTLVILIASFCFSGAAQPARKRVNDVRVSVIPANTLLQIVRAEDERRWDDSLKTQLADPDPRVRQRAALAAGRIGDEAAAPVLAEMLLQDRDNDVRQMAAFALGEIESPGGAYALVEVLNRLGQEHSSVRARAVEALGKIVAAMISAPASPDAATKALNDDRLDRLRAAIVDALRFEHGRRSMPDRLTMLLGFTAVLRAKPDGVGKLVAEFLGYSDARVVADALNTLARLRLKDGNDKARDLLAKDTDPGVRANAARVLGVTEDKAAFDVLLDRALHDSDLRVRVSAIRALAQLKEARATVPLLAKAQILTAAKNANWQNEVIELATTLGRLNEKSATPQVELGKWLSATSEAMGHTAVELETASARVSPERYVAFAGNDKYAVRMMLTNWRAGSRIAQGLGEIAALEKGDNSQTATRAVEILRAMLDYQNSGMRINTLVAVHSEYAVPDVLQALAAFKPKDLSEVARRHLNESDVIVRSAAAEILGEESSEANTRALIGALPHALRDADNDAVMAILGALAKQKNKEANDAIKTTLEAKDHLIRRRAVALLKTNGVGDFSDRIGTVQTRNTDADYRRAIARIGKKPTATVTTTKGSFTIEFRPDDATLNVDNFIQLAKKGYFNGQTVPRVVPNFVIQTGDPRGDQNGGPGYTIRCEINEEPYERAAVGMALSGKDTGGSQWFVTHSPQPHLDGGYTVFGHVIRGMEVVDQIARGDRIVRVVVNER